MDSSFCKMREYGIAFSTSILFNFHVYNKHHLMQEAGSTGVDFLHLSGMLGTPVAEESLRGCEHTCLFQSIILKWVCYDEIAKVREGKAMQRKEENKKWNRTQQSIFIYCITFLGSLFSILNNVINIQLCNSFGNLAVLLLYSKWQDRVPGLCETSIMNLMSYQMIPFKTAILATAKSTWELGTHSAYDLHCTWKRE